MKSSEKWQFNTRLNPAWKEPIKKVVTEGQVKWTQDDISELALALLFNTRDPYFHARRDKFLKECKTLGVASPFEVPSQCAEPHNDSPRYGIIGLRHHNEGEYGALDQLADRNTGSVEVADSTSARSTNLNGNGETYGEVVAGMRRLRGVSRRGGNQAASGDVERGTVASAGRSLQESRARGNRV